VIDDLFYRLETIVNQRNQNRNCSSFQGLRRPQRDLQLNMKFMRCPTIQLFYDCDDGDTEAFWPRTLTECHMPCLQTEYTDLCGVPEVIKVLPVEPFMHAMINTNVTINLWSGEVVCLTAEEKRADKGNINDDVLTILEDRGLASGPPASDDSSYQEQHGSHATAGYKRKTFQGGSSKSVHSIMLNCMCGRWLLRQFQIDHLYQNHGNNSLSLIYLASIVYNQINKPTIQLQTYFPGVTLIKTTGHNELPRPKYQVTLAGCNDDLMEKADVKKMVYSNAIRAVAARRRLERKQEELRRAEDDKKFEALWAHRDHRFFLAQLQGQEMDVDLYRREKVLAAEARQCQLRRMDRHNKAVRMRHFSRASAAFANLSKAFQLAETDEGVRKLLSDSLGKAKKSKN
jgi:hypothetical protein